MEKSQQQLVTIEELARILRFSKRSLLAEAKAGRIPCVVIGARRRFNVEAVVAVLAKRAAEHKGGEA